MMKISFAVINKRHLLIFLCVVLSVVSVVVYFTAIKPTFTPKAVHTIVIDAGHGGKDGGAVGRTSEATESYLNLQYALALERICKEYGFNVVQTRSDMNGLYSPFATNKKRSEMEKRKEIIEKANPDAVVSIHMNSFPSSEARGAQVYFAQGSESGESLADSVQKTLHKNVGYSKLTAKVGDFYVLNCTQSPSILVECGFLSNPEEEILLQDENYIQTFCYHLFCGILLYFNFQ